MLDWEIVCLDAQGRSRFTDLLFHWGKPCFVAFDLLWCAGKDLQYLPLIERKSWLRSVVRENAERVLHASHVEGRGEALFALACELDLEGIVAKHRSGPYLSDSLEKTLCL